MQEPEQFKRFRFTFEELPVGIFPYGLFCGICETLYVLPPPDDDTRCLPPAESLLALRVDDVEIMAKRVQELKRLGIPILLRPLPELVEDVEAAVRGMGAEPHPLT